MMAPVVNPRIPCLSIPQARALLGAGPLVVADCRGRLTAPEWGATVFEEGHLPGADYWDGEGDLCGPPCPKEGRHPMPDLEVFADLLRERGYQRTTPVLAYGAFAPRLLWLLDLLGFQSLYVLNGTWEDWCREGAGADLCVHPKTMPTGGCVSEGWDTGRMAVAGELLDGHVPVVDCRAHERYLGQTEPLDPVAGHIPGALNLPWMEVFDPEGHLLMPQPRGEVARALMAFPQRPILYCGSGITACAVWLGLLQWGCESRIYPGGWSAWIHDPGNPIALGIEKPPPFPGER